MHYIALYDMNDEGDREEFKLSFQASNMHAALFDILQEFRSKIKYDDKLSEDQDQILEIMQDKIIEILEDYDVSVS